MNPKFGDVPEPVAELLAEQLAGALQIIAALVLTDAEAAMIIKREDPLARDENIADWASSMRAQLLSKEWRPVLVRMLQHNKFLTNTSPEFPLYRLSAPPVSSIGKAYRLFERLCQEYAEGQGEVIRGDPEAEMMRRMKHRTSKHAREHVWKSGGGLLFWKAHVARLCKESQ